MERTSPERASPPLLSIGILAYNEEDGIKTTLESLFKQTIFAELERAGAWCEVVCVANGCVDATVAVADDFFAAASAHPHAAAFECRVEDIQEKGKTNALNQYYHRLSDQRASFLVLMDADILFREPETLHRLYRGLETDPEAQITVGRLYKDVQFKEKKTLLDRISLSTSDMTRAGKAQLSGQLYCIRGDTVRNIYFPKGLLVEDGFIKMVVCSDFFTRDTEPNRIKVVEGASHVFEAYKKIADVLNNQKRQMIAQTISYILADVYIAGLNREERVDFGRTMRQREQENPDWLKGEIERYIGARHFFWQLFPYVLSFRLRRLWSMSGAAKLTHAPTALIATAVQALSCFRAFRAFKSGAIDYWPDTKSQTLGTLAETDEKAAGQP